MIDWLRTWWAYRRLPARVRRLKLAHAQSLERMELSWRRQFTTLERQVETKKAKLQEAEDRAVEAIRRVATITYSRERTGELACQVVIPAMELAYYNPVYGNDFFRHMAGYVGRMVEREFAQINMATLAQSLREAEERQERYRRSDVFSRWQA